MIGDFMNTNHDVVILAGGKGTRLFELTKDRPKGLVNIGDKPILWHIMSIFAAQGCTRFVLCVGHMSDQIIEYFSDKKNINSGWEVVFDDAGSDVTKSVRIKSALKQIKSKNFFLAYGDDLANVDLDAIIACAQQTNSLVTITAVRPSSQFGVLQINSEKMITSIEEKPISDVWINGGFMLVSKNISKYLDCGEFEEQVLSEVAKLNHLSAYKHYGFWLAMNNYKQFLELESMYTEHKVTKTILPWNIKKERIESL